MARYCPWYLPLRVLGSQEVLICSVSALTDCVLSTYCVLSSILATEDEMEQKRTSPGSGAKGEVDSLNR